jgi:hypothetical protein
VKRGLAVAVELHDHHQRLRRVPANPGHKPGEQIRDAVETHHGQAILNVGLVRRPRIAEGSKYVATTGPVFPCADPVAVLLDG